MQTRKLGNRGLVVSALGLGCMGMSGVYGAADEVDAIATIHQAITSGRLRQRSGLHLSRYGGCVWEGA